MAQVRNGFTPTRTADRAFYKNHPVTLGADQALYPGDAVSLLNGQIVPCSAGMDPSYPVYGVVVGVLTTANRPLTHQTNKCIVSGGVGRASVCIDPDMTYLVRCDTSIGNAQVGENVMIDVSAGNAALGRSGMAVVPETSASVNNLFKIIGLSPKEELGGKETGFGAGQGVEVKINRGLLKAGTASQ